MMDQDRIGWPAVEATLDGILTRQYYTNQGPLACKLEEEICRRLSVRHAVLATNRALGLVMLLEALGVLGRVLLPSPAPEWQERAVQWAGLTAWRRDAAVDATSAGSAGVDCVAALVAADDLLGPVEVETGLLACIIGWLGSVVHGPALLALPGLGDGPGPACILTDDDLLAARLRNIRSSYGAGPPVTVRRTANGRVSEAQAGLVLAQLDRLPCARGVG